MIPRVLEPEFMDSIEEAELYDMMDHSQVNSAFARDLASHAPEGNDFCDLGTGTALIPIELCRLLPTIRIMACDAAKSMLEIARYRVEVAGVRERIQLHVGDAKQLVFPNQHFDCVFSNTLLHHLPDPLLCLQEATRVLKSGGLLFMRDLCRPSTEEALETLVATYAATEPEASKQLLRQSLHAALTLDEIKDLLLTMGLDADCVFMTSDRHWTLASKIP